ncbi:hypothetical protein M408DRAFT_326802 [Serendipita vermifera MAFF 305830]|uniref:Uncharacterized protein n=1 Tax=Serendipita vermifera MAFF 305830 TaxID=933852 RepID=A0A0C3BJ99_SERVB|nr:hypothetical protein M408DRAFT_326802 [Serendipita vermifera MAFF 305830]
MAWAWGDPTSQQVSLQSRVACAVSASPEKQTTKAIQPVRDGQLSIEIMLIVLLHCELDNQQPVNNMPQQNDDDAANGGEHPAHGPVSTTFPDGTSISWVY